MKTFMIIVVYISLVHGYRESSRYETRKSTYNASPSTSYYNIANGERTRESAKFVTTGTHNKNRQEGKLFGVARSPGVTVKEESYVAPQSSNSGYSNYVSSSRTGYSAAVPQTTYNAPVSKTVYSAPNIPTTHSRPQTVYKSVPTHSESSAQNTPQAVYSVPTVNTAPERNTEYSFQASKPVYYTQATQNNYRSASDRESAFRTEYNPSVGQTVYNVPELKAMYNNMVSNNDYSSEVSKTPTNIVHSVPQVTYKPSTEQSYRTQVPKPIYGVASQLIGTEPTSSMFSVSNANSGPVQFVYKAPAAQALYIDSSSKTVYDVSNSLNNAPVSLMHGVPAANVVNGVSSSLAVYKAPQTQAFYIRPTSKTGYDDSSPQSLYSSPKNQVTFNRLSNFNSISSPQYQSDNKVRNALTQFIFKSNPISTISSGSVQSVGRPVYRDPTLKTIPNGSGFKSSSSSSVSKPVYGVSSNRHDSLLFKNVHNSGAGQTVYSSPSAQNVHNTQSAQVYNGPSTQSVYRSPSPQSVYNAPSVQTSHSSPSAQTVYNAPSAQFVYNSPSIRTDYSGQTSENAYQSQQTIYKSSEAEPQYSVLSSKSTNNVPVDIRADSQNGNQYSSQETYSRQTSQNDYSGSAEYDRDYYYLHQPAGSTQDYSTPASVPQENKQVYYA